MATEAGCGAALDAPITLSARGGLALRIPGAVMCTVDELCFVTYRYCTIALLYGWGGYSVQVGQFVRGQDTYRIPYIAIR